MATPARSERWADFVRDQLDRRGWINQRLVEASGTKDNGRPIIDASRVKAWLEGEPPRAPEIIHAVARVFDVDVTAVLAAAGFLPDSETPTQLTRRPIGVREAIEADGVLADDAKRMLIAAYDSAIAPQRTKLRVAKASTPRSRRPRGEREAPDSP